ncbi:MAG: LytTR family transcriptional regulator DNA-binding domain-containing protein [Lachnospiraceae bacterium]|nr:LytTR family transcriptional regulator DNA-binding domain-containing protein [Lachnospiraceae bacterium]
MKLIKTKEEYITENYLELHYDTIDEETVGVLDRLRSALKYIEGTMDGKKQTVPLADIFYFETVDRKTFGYTRDCCIEISMTLQTIIDEYTDSGFVRISKSSIVNLYKIKKLQGDLNMRTLIYLKNDECLVMNRGYRKEFYEALNKLQGKRGK